jgi:hypothetical protein
MTMKRKLIALILGCSFIMPMAVVVTSPPAYADKGGKGKPAPKPPKPGPRDDGEGDD